MPSKTVQGSYTDEVIDRQGMVRWRSGWRSNLVVSRCSVLMAMLMKRHADAAGILYCAVGEGEPVWDSQRPLPLPATERLAREAARNLIAPEGMLFMDPAGEPADEPTQVLQVSIEFRGEELAGNGPLTLREFGLFGGDATDAAGSGFLINYVMHPRIDLSPAMTLRRTVRLFFGGGAALPEELAGFGADLPVSSIDGVGPGFDTAFDGQGIHTLADLIAVDPLIRIGSIPPVKLREFRTKARMVTGVKLTPASLEPLAAYSISDLLMKDPGEIAEGSGSAEINEAIVVRLQEELAILQIALDDAQVKNIILGDLTGM